MMKDINKPVPEVGKEYHFWDDGKSSPSRHYICRCERILKTKKEAKSIMFTLEKINYKISLYEIWKKESAMDYWLFAEDTDCFVEISCPKYDKYKLWAVRTKNGGWFTLDIQSSWQGGDIDVTGEKFNSIIEEYKDEGKYDVIEKYMNETY